MKTMSTKIGVCIAAICILSAISCDSDSTSDIKSKILGTWEIYSVVTYDIETLKILDSERLFEESFKWELIITEDGQITKPAKSKYDREETANYEIYTGSEALKEGIIGKKHQRRAVGSDEDIILLFTNKAIKGERLFQIVNCSNDTLKLRFLSTDCILDDQIFEFKMVKK
jgi:hypothetical protein